MIDPVKTYTPRVVGVGRGEAVFAVEYPQALFRRNLRNPVMTAAPSVAVSPRLLDGCPPRELGRAVVAEAVNQLLEHGAEPVCVSVSVWGLEAAWTADAAGGCVDACRDACCVLMPLRAAGRDGRGIAACAVGVAEQKKLVDSARVGAGDVVMGIPAGGFLPADAQSQGSGGEALVRAGRPLNRAVLHVLRRYRRKRPVHAVAAPGPAFAGKPGETAPAVAALLERKLGADVVLRVTIDPRDLAAVSGPFWPARAKDADAALARGACGFGLVLVVGRPYAHSIAHALKRRGAAPLFLGEIEGLRGAGD